MNRKILIGLTTLTLGAAAAAQAGHGHGRGNGYGYGHDRGDRDVARVVHVQPLVERVRYSVPVEECWDEQRVRRGGRGSASGAIVGGVVGAMVGSTVGRGDDRQVATVGGALLGAAIGSQVGERRDYRAPRREVRQYCEVHEETRWEERVVAYRVTYVYNGRRDVTRLGYDPGSYFRLADARDWEGSRTMTP
jgi:uncharacterized protein YcfJ